jgi:hypothetical protein
MAVGLSASSTFVRAAAPARPSPDPHISPVVFREFGLADRILGLTRNCARAVEAAQLREDVAAGWLTRLAEAPFLAAVTLYLVTATRPA